MPYQPFPYRVIQAVSSTLQAEKKVRASTHEVEARTAATGNIEVPEDRVVRRLDRLRTEDELCDVCDTSDE